MLGLGLNLAIPPESKGVEDLTADRTDIKADTTAQTADQTAE